MEKDKLYFFYDGEMPLGAWMYEVCNSCVSDFGYGTKACEKCPFELPHSECIITKLSTEGFRYLNEMTPRDVKDYVSLSEWQFLKSHCGFKDEYDEEDSEVEEMDLINTLNNLADGMDLEVESGWNFGKPKENGSYIVVTVYSDDHDDKVKSMYLADWRDGGWDSVPYEDMVLCWTLAPEMPVISLSIGDKVFTF